MGTTEWVYLLLAAFFLVVCAFFSSAEIGFINLQRIRLKHLQDEGVHGADRVARIMRYPERFLSTVLTGISFAETIVVSLATIFIVALLGESLGTPLAIVLIAIILLVFAKVIPKTVAAQHPERIALLYGPIIEILQKLMHPIIIALSWMIGKLNLLTHSKTVPGALISREEINTIISVGQEEGMVDEDAAQMLRKVFGLGDCQVKEIMTPRTEVKWLEDGATLGDFFAVYSENPTRRYPVYEGTQDNVRGILSIRDVLGALAEGSIRRNSRVTNLARQPYFVPGSKTVGELFSEMRSGGYMMAVVVDEYGGSLGTVSIDQVIEEIVGEVREGLVGAKKPFRVVGESTFRITGSMRVEEANEELDLDLPVGEYKTIGGFALHLFGHLPREGEQAFYEDLKFVATQVKDNKITRLLVTKEKREQERTEEQPKETFSHVVDGDEE
jgi:putative hemolysin